MSSYFLSETVRVVDKRKCRSERNLWLFFWLPTYFLSRPFSLQRWALPSDEGGVGGVNGGDGNGASLAVASGIVSKKCTRLMWC